MCFSVSCALRDRLDQNKTVRNTALFGLFCDFLSAVFFVIGWIRIEVAGMLLCISFTLCLDVSRVCHNRLDRDPLVMLQAREVNVVSKGRGPRAALTHANLAARTGPEKVTWLEESRIDAIIGSCSLSLKSVRSGVRCYMAFAGSMCFCMWHRACCAHDVFQLMSKMLAVVCYLQR